MDDIQECFKFPQHATEGAENSVIKVINDIRDRKFAFTIYIFAFENILFLKTTFWSCFGCYSASKTKHILKITERSWTPDNLILERITNPHTMLYFKTERNTVQRLRYDTL